MPTHIQTSIHKHTHKQAQADMHAHALTHEYGEKKNSSLRDDSGDVALAVKHEDQCSDPQNPYKVPVGGPTHP